MISIGTVYTYFRLNLRSFSHLIKNLYGALGLPIIFLLGAGSLKTEVIIYYFLFSIFIFGGSIVADLRDYTGDKKIGKKTVPVVVGYSKSKIISCAIILAFASLIFCLELKSFFLLGAASLLMIVLVAKDMPKHAHLTGGLSFLVTSLWLLILH
jgi:4-hydroxybenzoate polyprenyltransferase